MSGRKNVSRAHTGSKRFIESEFVARQKMAAERRVQAHRVFLVGNSAGIVAVFMQRLILMLSIFGFLFGSAVAQEETRLERSTREKNDREVIRELAKAGSDLSKPHKIEFHFVGYDEAKVLALAEEGRKAGYSVSAIDSMVDRDARKYWYFDLIQEVIPTEKNIFGHTAVMAKLAKKHAVEFDGWGCLIVK